MRFRNFAFRRPVTLAYIAFVVGAGLSRVLGA